MNKMLTMKAPSRAVSTVSCRKTFLSNGCLVACEEKKRKVERGGGDEERDREISPFLDKDMNSIIAV